MSRNDNLDVELSEEGAARVIEASDGGVTISIMNLERIEHPIPVSSFRKVSDGTPLKPRTRAGNWSYVFPLPPWVGKIADTAVQDDLAQDLDERVRESMASSEQARAERLANADPLPSKIQIVSKGYRRNPDVIATVLIRANGVCEHCRKPAPFNRSSNGSPYLEVHHRLLLSQSGEDTVENAIAVCPNCHRLLHFGV